VELAFSKPFIYDFNALFGFEGVQTKKIQNIYLKKKVFLENTLYSNPSRSLFYVFFSIKI
jgi:hypothetical protein